MDRKKIANIIKNQANQYETTTFKPQENGFLKHNNTFKRHPNTNFNFRPTKFARKPSESFIPVVNEQPVKFFNF